MVKKIFIHFIWVVFALIPLGAHAQSGIKVVPAGETIKPEANVPAKKRRRPAITVVKAGTALLVELRTAVSSGLTQEGDTVYIAAAEDLGPSSRPAITLGAPGQGKVIHVKKDKKAGELTIRLENIEDAKGDLVPISGEIVLKGKKSQAMAPVGERFTARLEEKVIGKSRSTKKKASKEPGPLQAFVEISGKKAEADLAKGKAKGKVKVVLEAPKGFTADDIDPDSVVLSEVNTFDLEKPVPANAGKIRMGDANRNGTTDWTLYFHTWDFIKNQPRGTNTIHISGKMENGRPFDAVTRVKIGY